MEITLQCSHGCPNWETTHAHLLTLIAKQDLDANLRYQLIDTPEAAVNTASGDLPL